MPALSIMSMEQALPALVAPMCALHAKGPALLAWAQLCMHWICTWISGSPGTVLAGQKANTSLCTTLLNTDAALARAMLSRAASPSSPWVPVSHRGISVVLHWWHNQPQVGAF